MKMYRMLLKYKIKIYIKLIKSMENFKIIKINHW